MANLSKSVVIAFGTALVGCSSMSGVMAAGCNPGGNCSVDVTVGANCAISISPDPLDVPQPRGAKSITWTIVTSGYEFASNGIAFKSPNSEFVDPVWQGKNLVGRTSTPALVTMRTTSMS